jgi:hypothetical protein
MKKIRFSFLLYLTVISFTPVAETKAQLVSVNFSTFHRELSPYGRWMNNPRFGQVWIYNAVGFKPYNTDGHWEYTNYGWSWESDHDWGWAPFHYGRWEFDPYYGWMWIPGYEWASAWVSWSSYDDYYGWAPLGYGININVSFGSIPYNNWNFIPRRNICDRDLNRYYVSYHSNNNFRNAVVINNYYYGNGGVGRYVRGPERREVERYSNNPVQERRIDYADRNRNRSNNVRNSNDNNRNASRNYDQENQNNNERSAMQANENKRQQNNVTRQDRRQTDDVVRNNYPENDHNRRWRDLNPNADINNTSPPVYEKRKPAREVITTPQTIEINDPGRRQNENRMNRNNDQPNSIPQKQQNGRPPIHQNERQIPQQQRQPEMEQRKMERRVESDNGRNSQRANNNNQRQNSNNEKRRNRN